MSRTPTRTTFRYRRNLAKVVRRIAGVPGDIWELGVFKGTNSVLFADLIRKASEPRKYVGFDSFRGYTEEDIGTSPNAAALAENQRKGRWRWSRQAVEQELARRGLADFARIVEGDIKETVPERVERERPTIALLYLDCNAYLPAIRGIEACWGALAGGALICVDEHRVGGETQALREICDRHGLQIEETGWVYPHGPPRLATVRRSR